MSTITSKKIKSFSRGLRNVYNFTLLITKVLSLIICICEAFAYVWSGAYGELSTLGTGNALFIIFQLVFAGIIVIMLDEMIQKGYGLGSGISLFIATNLCENILWRAFS